MNMKNVKMVECPSCLGSKEVFNPFDDKMISCNFCKGEGKVTEEKNDLYDPVGYELGISSATFHFDDEEDE